MNKLVMTGIMLGTAIGATAGVTYKNDDGDYMKLGGRIQLQYHMEDPSGGESSDELLFRRFRPYIEGSVTKDWKGKFQFDLGKGSLALKDAYMQYKGFDGLKITIGNANTSFSRELLTSSKYQQLVERTFVGDHNYGTPDRQTGLHVSGGFAEDLITWQTTAAMASQDPDNKKLDFEPTIQIDKGGDWSDGIMLAGRVELSPMGPVKFSQGNFGGDAQVSVGLGAFTWNNDDDNLSGGALDDAGALKVGKQDVDSVTGVEVSAAVRVAGLSLDAQFNTFDSDLVQKGVTDGLYKNSKTTLENYAVEGGYMVIPNRLELVAGFQAQDADNYADTWTRTSVGANVFVDKHNVKYQFTYQIGENKNGKAGADVDEVFAQAQYVF